MLHVDLGDLLEYLLLGVLSELFEISLVHEHTHKGRREIELGALLAFDELDETHADKLPEDRVFGLSVKIRLLGALEELSRGAFPHQTHSFAAQNRQ